ncbi:hypothetical protein BL253_08410 [Pseudofrankia asymbiotica]|uniref:Uncharacterized protein n=1 Tax=Pseudofrankia asymbiotica TaxID=1834516 RepID=A0A1V2IF92_9ACTN|nr:hypothetical protein BL253_08410 [Pseudofrankia asymbiotica]
MRAFRRVPAGLAPVAPLVAPAVDLSVVTLPLGSRQLAVNGRPVEVPRWTRRPLGRPPVR